MIVVAGRVRAVVAVQYGADVTVTPGVRGFVPDFQSLNNRETASTRRFITMNNRRGVFM
jgi:hypothetical protein